MKRGIVLGVIIAIVFASFYLGYFRMNQTSNFNLDNKYGISGKVIDSGTYNNLEEVMEQIQKSYTENKEKGEVYFVFGNKEGVRLVSYNELITGNVAFVFGNNEENIEITKKEYISKTLAPRNSKVEVEINGKKYFFDLINKQNLYMILADSKENGKEIQKVG